MTADVKNYYPAYDLLKVTNSVNLFVLIDQILEEQSKSLLQQLTKADFYALLEEIYLRINTWVMVDSIEDCGECGYRGECGLSHIQHDDDEQQKHQHVKHHID